MHIQTLNLQGIKAIDRRIDLAPLTLIAGPNASGKTAILEAIRFVLLGYVPGVGKTNQAIFDLAGSASMGAEILMNNGQSYGRSLALNGSSVKSSDTGENPEAILTSCLDPELYFGLTESQRVQYIFDHCHVEGAEPDALVAKICNSIQWEEMTEERVKAKQEATGRIIKSSNGDASIQELLEVMAEACRDQYKQQNTAAKESQGAVTTLTELRLSSEQTFSSVTALIAEQTKLQSELGSLQQASGVLAARCKNAEQSARMRQSLEQAIAAPVITEEAITALEQSARDCNKRAESILVPELSDDIPALQQAAYAASRMEQDANGALASARTTLDVAKSNVNCTGRELEALEAQECCPHCKSTGKTWKSKLRATIQESLSKAIAEQESADAAHGAAILKYTEAAEASKLAALAFQQANAQSQEQVALRNSKQAALQQALSAVKEAEQLKHRRAEQLARQTQARQQLAELAEVELPTEEELAHVSARIAEVKSQLALIEGRLDAANRAKNDIMRAEQSAQKHKEHAALRDAYQMAGKAVVAIKGSLVSDAFKSLLEKANSVTGDLLKTPLAYNAERNELGRYRGHVFVSHKTLSGVEKALAYIGLSVALSWDAPFRIVLLDEVIRMTNSKLEVVMERLRELVENDVIHQAIAIKPSDTPDLEVADGWSVVVTEDMEVEVLA